MNQSDFAMVAFGVLCITAALSVVVGMFRGPEAKRLQEANIRRAVLLGRLAETAAVSLRSCMTIGFEGDLKDCRCPTCRTQRLIEEVRSQ